MYDIPTEERIQEAEQKAINSAVQTQLDLQIRPICSGEYSRHIFYSGFFEVLEGMTPVTDLPIVEGFRTDFPTTTKLAQMGAKTRAAVVCTGPIRWKESAYMDEWKMLRSSLPASQWSDCKITLPAPSYQHIQLKPGTAYTPESGYTSDEQYFTDLAKAYASEIKALYDEGCRNIQIDGKSFRNMLRLCVLTEMNTLTSRTFARLNFLMAVERMAQIRTVSLTCICRHTICS
jgi:methionine synthase II (cobalamin-independent)